MKLPIRLKWTVLTTLSALYATGVITWVMGKWFLINQGFGSEPSPLRTLWLQMHSIMGLWFMVLFGYLFHSHVRPAWHRGKKIKSGTAFTALMIFLMANVPFLFYATNEKLKNSVAWVHTYVGLTAVAFFLIHYFSKVRQRD